MKKAFYLLLFLVATFSNVHAQVGIGIATPHQSAQLQVASTSKGLLIPRMTTAQRTAIASPAQGLLVYNTDDNSFWYYNASAWVELKAPAGWLPSGNAGTADGTNFIGTTDDVPLNFRVNNEKAGRIDGGLANTFLGYNAGAANEDGNNNAAVGALALQANTGGKYNVAVGVSVLQNNTAEGNTANGYRALYFNTTGYRNAANGYYSLVSNTTGSYNTVNGTLALPSNTTGNGNTANGYHALNLNTTGNYNTAIGFNANVASGNLTNATAIGANATVSASNSMVLGGIGANAVKVGIGVTTPVSALHINGTEKLFSAASSYTGNFSDGTASVNGIELVTAGTDAYVSIQRTSGYGLNISKVNTIPDYKDNSSYVNGLIGFFVNGRNIGSIEANPNNGGTVYLTTSDYRLKENIRSSAYGLSTLMKIGVEDYNYTSDNKKAVQTGVMAQQLYNVFPQAVHVGGKDARTDPWMVDYSKLTPMLVKAVQEQQGIIEKQDAELKKLREQTGSENATLKDQVLQGQKSNAALQQTVAQLQASLKEQQNGLAQRLKSLEALMQKQSAAKETLAAK